VQIVDSGGGGSGVVVEVVQVVDTVGGGGGGWVYLELVVLGVLVVELVLVGHECTDQEMVSHLGCTAAWVAAAAARMRRKYRIFIFRILNGRFEAGTTGEGGK
jgi:hypothetical protein